MSKAIEANLLSKEIMKALESCSDNILEEVKKTANKVGKEAIEELEKASPKRKKRKLRKRLAIKK